MDQRARRLRALLGDPEDAPEKPQETPGGSRNLGRPCAPPPPGPAPTPSPGQRDDLIATVLTEVSPEPLELLRQRRSFRKLLKRQRRELERLRKKHLRRLLELHRRSAGAAPLLQLREEQQRQELGRQQEQLREAQLRLQEVALEAQRAQLKQLRQTSEREKKELQKILERKRHSSISEARGGRRGGELPEINRRHINESVTSIRRLEEAQRRRELKLREEHLRVLEQIREEPRLSQELQQDPGGLLTPKTSPGTPPGTPPGGDSTPL